MEEIKEDSRTFIYATYEDVLKGYTSDIYFFRTLKVLKEKGLDKTEVYAEFTPSSFPKDYEWAVFAGLREVVKLLRNKPVTLYSLPEGTVFRLTDHYGFKIPVMAIEGKYGDFLIYETPILGFLSSASGIATKAARIKKAAGSKMVISFGARRIHPALSPFEAYYAYVGGCDAVSCVQGAKFLGIKPVGTMPHSLMIIFRAIRGDHTEAWKAFDEVVEKDVPRVILVDTFWDETEEAVRAAQLLKEKIWGVRLDTPGNRRGNFPEIIREVRWKLRAMGFSDVKIIVSGGVNEYSIPKLKEAGADVFGVGAAIANSPIIDYAMDITSIKVNNVWRPITKRGKLSGRKQLYRCSKCMIDIIRLEKEERPSCPNCGELMTPMLIKVLDQGKVVHEPEPPSKLREKVLEQISKLP
ncbi:MAG TPA: nicotinate phosphoribosyltransferase [Thermofilum sp.]|nr:nicotinate phosphoribosyltransferase [Thermofilum sp.]